MKSGGVWWVWEAYSCEDLNLSCIPCIGCSTYYNLTETLYKKPKPLAMRLKSQKEANGTTPKGIEEDKSQKEAGMAQ